MLSGGSAFGLSSADGVMRCSSHGQEVDFRGDASWNDFVGPLIFLNHERMFTVSLGLFMYQSQHGGTPWNLVMAATMIVILPVLVLFLLAQRAFVEGIATQGVKG